MTTEATPPLFLNRILEAYTKIRTVQKIVPDFKIFYAHSGGLMPAEDAAKAARVLASTETALLNAEPYQLDQAVVIAFHGSKPDVRNDMTLPSPITWIDQCSATNGIANTGALLVEGDKGKIGVTLFTESKSILSLSGLKTVAEKDLPDLFRHGSGLMNKLEPLGKHYKSAKIIVPDIVYDRKTGDVAFSTEKSFRPMYRETSYGVPAILDYNTLKQPAMINKMQERNWLNEARKALELAQAITKNDPRIKTTFVAPKQKSSGDQNRMRNGIAPTRVASRVEANRDHAEARLVAEKIAPIFSIFSKKTPATGTTQKKIAVGQSGRPFPPRHERTDCGAGTSDAGRSQNAAR